jgi:hypothetical protein
LMQSPDNLALYAYILSLFNRPHHMETINLALDQLLSEPNVWMSEATDLCVAASVSCSLLRLTPVQNRVIQAVEEWLISTFDLAQPYAEPDGPPAAYMSLIGQLPPDLWLRGWMQASTALALYLKRMLPNYSVAEYPPCSIYCSNYLPIDKVVLT